jgi:putative hydrolase of the HAD superfamily
VKIQALLLDIGNVCVRLRTHEFLQRVSGMGRPGLTPAEVLESLRAVDSAHLGYEKGQIDGEGFYHAQVERLGLGLSYHEWLREWNAYFEPNRPMEALIARLHLSNAGRLKLWALSNTNHEHFEHLKLNFRLFDGFTGFTASHLCGSRKPEPGIYQDAIKRLGLPPEQVLYLDDVQEYVEAGRSHGLRAFHYIYNDRELHAELQALGVELPPLDGRSSMAC